MKYLLSLIFTLYISNSLAQKKYDVILKSIENNGSKYKNVAKDFTSYGTNKTKGALVNRIINQYKLSKNLFIINLVPNQFYCLAGYWIEQINPGKFQSIFLEISNEKINDYKDIKKEVDDFFKNFNSEYESIKIEIKNLF